MSAYATLADADSYFGDRLYSELWDTKSPSDRQKALNTASQHIDRLAFADDVDMTNQDIKIACMEIAYSLLDGKDPEKELEGLAVISQGFSNVRDTLDRSFVHEHLNAGIVSALAWKYLRPYLRDDKTISLSRV